MRAQREHPACAQACAPHVTRRLQVTPCWACVVPARRHLTARKMAAVVDDHVYRAILDPRERSTCVHTVTLQELRHLRAEGTKLAERAQVGVERPEVAVHADHIRVAEDTLPGGEGFATEYADFQDREARCSRPSREVVGVEFATIGRRPCGELVTAYVTAEHLAVHRCHLAPHKVVVVFRRAVRSTLADVKVSTHSTQLLTQKRHAGVQAVVRRCRHGRSSLLSHAAGWQRQQSRHFRPTACGMALARCPQFVHTNIGARR
eukprot:4774081-Prymnesium_polylepis.1